MYVSVAIVRAFADALNRRAISTEQFCQAAGLDPGHLASSTAMVSVVEYARVLETAVRLAGDPALALRVGEQAPSGALHTVGYLLLNCRTIRDAIAQFVRLAELVYEGARFELREQDRAAVFSFAHDALEGPMAPHDAEFCLAFIVGVGRHFSGRDHSPREVHFRHRAPEHLAEHERVFRCPVYFERPRNEIVFKRSLLDVPQLLRDEPVAQLLRRHAEALLAERHSEAHLERRLADLVKYEPALDTLDAEALAQRLGVSPRTLRRRLATLDLTVAEIVERARCDLAREALASTTPIKAIAERLGYSEQSAFHRAFKRWTGMTPGRYRATQRGGAGTDPDGA